MTLVQVGDIELDYERSGGGEPLLAIMGMSGTALHWGEAFLAPLRERFDVIAYDHRGVGASSRLDGPITIGDMAQDAAWLLDALGVGSAHILGISMGGMIAQDLVLARPDLVRTLVIGCSYCGGPGSALVESDVLARPRRRCSPATASAPCAQAGRRTSRRRGAMTRSATGAFWPSLPGARSPCR